MSLLDDIKQSWKHAALETAVAAFAAPSAVVRGALIGAQAALPVAVGTSDPTMVLAVYIAGSVTDVAMFCAFNALRKKRIAEANGLKL